MSHIVFHNIKESIATMSLGKHTRARFLPRMANNVNTAAFALEIHVTVSVALKFPGWSNFLCSPESFQSNKIQFAAPFSSKTSQLHQQHSVNSSSETRKDAPTASILKFYGKVCRFQCYLLRAPSDSKVVPTAVD